MKIFRNLILILVFIFLIQITLAVCCLDENNKEGGCYPERNICCEETDKIVGYVGCKYAVVDQNNEFSNFDYKCPTETIGTCWECSEDCQPDGTDCEWIDSNNCEDETCFVEYVDYGLDEFPYSSECTDLCGEGQIEDENGDCVDIPKDDIEDVICYNSNCMTNKYCCKKDGSYDKDETGEIKDAVCSGDNDNDGVCNYWDNCPETENPKQEDSDNDGIGDACEFEAMCWSAYGDKQCCDELPQSKSGKGSFYGFTPDCLGPIGCWSSCIGEDASDNKITYEVGPCIDGERTVKIIDEGGNVLETIIEPCSGIPLIPFFTNFNLLITFLILFLFYFFRKR